MTCRKNLSCGRLLQDPFHRFVARSPYIGSDTHPVVVHIEAERGCRCVLRQSPGFPADFIKFHAMAAKFLGYSHLQVTCGLELVEVLLAKTILPVVHRCTFP